MASILAARQALNALRLSTSFRPASLIQRRGLSGTSDLHGPKEVDFLKDPETPSPSKEEHEIIFINIDTSKWMLRLGRCYQLQVDCARAYCRAKLKSNPGNAIGIHTMGATEYTRRLEPTSDLDKILGHLRCIGALGGGELDFVGGLTSCWDKLDHYPSNPKRIIFFTGGPTNFEIKEAKWFGEKLKQQGIAVDVVNFFLNEGFVFYKLALDAFVAAVNNNNNSHIKHVQPDSRTRVSDVLSSLAKRKSKEFKLKNEAAAHEAYLKNGTWSLFMKL